MARSIELSRKSPDDKPKPYDLAFVAMTQFQLGDKKSAAASLQQLRELMRDQENAKDEDNQSFLKEAQALIEQNDPAAGK
jgi:hypothetical protein